MKKRDGKCVWTSILLVVVGVVFFAGGYVLRGRFSSEQDTSAAATVAKTVCTCSMHPQVRQDKPGKCDFCAMELIPLDPDADSGGAGIIVFSD